MIFKMNDGTEIEVETPFGMTEKINVGEIVKQGTVLGPTLCSVSTDQINKVGESQERNLGRELIGILVFVDDVMSATDTVEEREKMIEEVTEILKLAGFSLKYVVKSGEKPCEEASTDGVSVKTLGYCWKPEEDTFSPGMGEMNFNKKVRGAKRPNIKPISTYEDLKEVLEKILITRRIAASKVAEF